MKEETLHWTDITWESHIRELIAQSLSDRPWTEEEQKQKLINPKEKLWNWDIELFVSIESLNRESQTPIEKTALRSLFEVIEQQVTTKRIIELHKQPRKSFAQLIAQTYPETKFILDPFFEAGTVNMISAPPNTWKSWMFFLMATSIAQGSTFLDTFQTTKQKVLIVNEEDTERLIAERFALLGIEDPTLEIYFRTAQGSKLTTEYCASLLEECKKDGISVIMFDSLRALHDADENSSTAIQPVLDNLKMLSREGITVIFTHHHKKKNVLDRGDTSESSRGSSAINAAIFGHLSLEEVEKETGTYLVFRHLKSKTTQKLPPFEVLIDTENGVHFTMVGDYSDEAKSAEKTKQMVYEYVKQNGMHHWTSTKEIVHAEISPSEKYIRLALKGLTTSGILVSKTKQQLEEEHPGRTFIGSKNSRFYQLGTITLEEDEEAEKDTDAAFALL